MSNKKIVDWLYDQWQRDKTKDEQKAWVAVLDEKIKLFSV